MHHRNIHVSYRMTIELVFVDTDTYVYDICPNVHMYLKTNLVYITFFGK